ncbi:lipoyl synthase [bacterium]|nr:lipoyl synthase [bacterium]
MKPRWLQHSFITSPRAKFVTQQLRKHNLFTICEEGHCPNKGTCYSAGRATFMILGDICTRNCGFCSVKKGIPGVVNGSEAESIAIAVRDLELKHVVLTSVTRDDLTDGGAGHFKKCVKQIRQINPDTRIEVLIPDFKGDESALQTVMESEPDILNHNTETVERLYPLVRPQADYHLSLQLLRRVKSLGTPRVLSKSGFMLGLGEQEEEIQNLMKDLRAQDCDILTIGQYLQPTPSQLQVVEYIHPSKFQEYQHFGEELGFKAVYSGPLIRSSYNAESIWEKL